MENKRETIDMMNKNKNNKNQKKYFRRTTLEMQCIYHTVINK